MSLNIKHPEADRLAHSLAEKTGETITETVIKALQERLAREEGRTILPSIKDDLLTIGKRCAALPDLDTSSAEDILGYDAHGLPG
ncbi:MAG: type II toxin-antitoxin system VapB family antitoxin [Candidatus Binataceae bacterium]